MKTKDLETTVAEVLKRIDAIQLNMTLAPMPHMPQRELRLYKMTNMT
jgi:hypothetical protein